MQIPFVLPNIGELVKLQIIKLAYAPPRRSEVGSDPGSDARSGLSISTDEATNCS